MPYSTVAQVRSATPFKNSIKISDSYVTDKIADADSVINGKISSVYQLPLAISGVASTPDVIEQLSIQLATSFMYAEQYSEETAGSAGADPKKLQEMAMAILDDIADQKQPLVNSSGVEYDRSNFYQVSGYPDQTSTDGGDTEPLFEVGQQF